MSGGDDGEMNEHSEERERTSAIMKVFPSTGSAHKGSVCWTPLTLQEVVKKHPEPLHTLVNSLLVNINE